MYPYTPNLDDGLEVAPFQDKQVVGEPALPDYAGTPDTYSADLLPSSKTGTSTTTSNSQHIGGLRRSIFWFLLTAIVFVVMGVSLGAGFAIGSKNTTNKSVTNAPESTSAVSVVTSPATTSPTTTSTDMRQTTASSSASTISSTSSPTTTTSSSPTSTSPITDCPTSNNTLYSSRFKDALSGPVSPDAGLTFTKYCDFNVDTGSSAANTKATLAEVFVSNFTNCIETCASINFYSGSRNCTSALFTVVGTESGTQINGNCWVSTLTGGDLVQTNGLNVAVLD